MGPRWEFVWSCVPGKNGGVWIVTGETTVSNSVLTWTPAEGYRIAIYNDSLKYMDELLGDSDSPDDHVMHSLSVAGLEAQADGTIRAVGARGLFSVNGKTITPLLWFDRTPKDWRPDTLLSLGQDRYFISCHWGGSFLLRKDARGQWEAVKVDPKG